MRESKKINLIRRWPFITAGVSLYVVHVAIVLMAAFYNLHSLAFFSYLWPYSLMLALQVSDFYWSSTGVVAVLIAGLILVSAWCFLVDKVARRFRVDAFIFFLIAPWIWFVPLFIVSATMGTFAQLMGWPIHE
jgi:hypothetical protein